MWDVGEEGVLECGLGSSRSWCNVVTAGRLHALIPEPGRRPPAAPGRTEVDGWTGGEAGGRQGPGAGPGQGGRGRQGSSGEQGATPAVGGNSLGSRAAALPAAGQLWPGLRPPRLHTGHWTPLAPASPPLPPTWPQQHITVLAQWNEITSPRYYEMLEQLRPSH